RSLEAALNYVSLGGAAMFAAYLLSGLFVVAPDEVAVVLRLGGFAGGTPATAIRQPGLHFAWPSPIDEVVRVRVKKIYELTISDLHYGDSAEPTPAVGGVSGLTAPTTGVIDVAARSRRRAEQATSGMATLQGDVDEAIDPVAEGYALTGDRNVVQIDMVARYQVSDPVRFALHLHEPDRLLRDAIMAATVQSMGEAEVDDLLSNGRSQFQVRVVQRAQGFLDEVSAGISLVSLEVTELAPPRQVRGEFEQVQNAYIDIQTKLKEANRQREQALPKARSDADTEIRKAEGDAAELLALARGDAAMWRQLYAEYRQNPSVVRERVYLEAIEGALANAGRRRWVPPPTTGRRYGDDDFRITIPASPRGIQ
ncbi:MAG: FtsH protease activity modulator HflK, partial [Myxococcota bacterium]